MAKSVGFAATVTLDDVLGTPVDISGDVTNLSVNTPYGVQDISGADQEAAARLLLSADGTGTLNGIFNPALSHAVLATSTVSGVARTLTITFPGPVTATAEVIVGTYSVALGEDGSLVWSAPWELTGGTALAWS
jgi:hypothetical protein